ncbi:MAG: sensor histidine kinase [Anaerolineae bacterium]
MSQAPTEPDDFLTKASTILERAQRDLQALADEARTYHERAASAPGGDNDQTPDGWLLHVRQLGEQIENLAKRNLAFKNHLTAGLEAPPLDDQVWPRIRILQSHEVERARIARELEKTTGQLLADAIFELASVRRLTQAQNGNVGPDVAEGLLALQNELEHGLARVRQLITDLEPATILGNFGLISGLRRYLERFETRTGLTTELQVKANIGRLPGTMEISIFRIIQEVLHNIERHAQATHIKVIAEEQSGALVFTVEDDGVGLNPNRISKRGRSLGLVSMRDYAELLDGRLRIRSGEERGTQVILSVPYPAT